MYKALKALALATGVIVLSGAAIAADVARPPPAPQPVIVAPHVYNWNGWYLGVQGGWDSNHASTTPFSSTENGGLFGVYGGVNFMAAGNWLWGLDASINWDNAQATSTTPNCFCAFNAGPNWKGFLRGRLGWTADRLLLYGTFGAATTHYVVTGAGAGSATPWGWTAGLGAEMAITDNLVGRLDWAYQNYGTFTLSPSSIPVHLTANTFTAGIALKF